MSFFRFFVGSYNIHCDIALQMIMYVAARTLSTSLPSRFTVFFGFALAFGGVGVFFLEFPFDVLGGMFQ